MLSNELLHPNAVGIMVFPAGCIQTSNRYLTNVGGIVVNVLLQLALRTIPDTPKTLSGFRLHDISEIYMSEIPPKHNILDKWCALTLTTFEQSYQVCRDIQIDMMIGHPEYTT
jgi:hypothetical protein